MGYKLKSSYKLGSDRIFDIVNITIIILTLIVIIFPLVNILASSFSNPKSVIEGRVFLIPVRPTLEGYIRIFKDERIILGYRNTIFYTLVGTFISVVLTVLGAYPLSRKEFIGRGFFIIVITIPMFLSGGLIPTFLLIKQLGLYNSVWAIFLVGAISSWNIIVTRTYFQTTIPNELKESAEIDGANSFQFLLKIVFPLSTAIIAVMALFYGVGYWNDFFNAMIYLNDKKMFPLQLFLRDILIQNDMATNSMGDLGNSKDAAEYRYIAEVLRYSTIVVASAPLLIVYPFLQKYFVKGVMIGAIKG